MIQLRRLEEKDALGMLEWMQDPSITEYFDLSDAQRTLESIHKFIKSAQASTQHFHFAIVNGQDEYLGTISLKNIHPKNRHAEYAIVLRKSAQGQGFGSQATELLIEKARTELNLHKIYLNAISTNLYAIKLYQKHGFMQKGIFEDHLFHKGKFINLVYFELILGENA